MTNEERWQLQTAYWENILLLDGELLNPLLKRLANADDAVSTNELIVKARKVILGLDTSDISPEDLNNWLPEPPA